MTLLSVTSTAQNAPLRIALLSDAADAGAVTLDSLIQEELEALLDTRFDLTVQTLYTGGDASAITGKIKEAYAANDFVIATGIFSSAAMLDRTNFAKPTIAAAVLNAGNRGGAEGTGVENFTFVRSPFNIERDLDKLTNLQPHDFLTVVTTAELRPVLQAILPAYTDATVDFVTVTPGMDDITAQLPANTQAVYVTPLNNVAGPRVQRKFYQDAGARGLATFALIDRPALDYGALAAFSSEENLAKLPRRVALDVLKITDGIDAGTLNTDITSYTSTLIVNMEAARDAGIYPDWKLIRSAIVLNPTAVNDGEELTFEGAILEGLAANLGYKLSEYDVAIAQTEVGLAKANLLPQIEAATTVTRIDGQTVASSFGQQGRYNWTANASLSQVILSEPAFANKAIQELLLEGQRAKLESAQLDVVLDVSTAYLNALQAREFARLQNENLNLTRRNYNLALNQRNLGAIGAGDVYRWESELALGAINVNDAEAQLAQARYNLNQLLNRPINGDFRMPAFTGQDTLLGIVGETLLPVLGNPRDIDRLADFLAAEAKENLPTLRQLETAIAAQERQALASRRAFYMPQVALSGQYNYRIGNYKTTPLPPDLGFDFASEDRPRSTYNLALNVSIPIFQGGARKFQAEQARVAALQTRTQRQDVENQLLTRLYASVETTVASYRNLNLAREAATTSTKNFAIVEDLYRSGATNITSLVDAQNVVLQSNINATNAGYQFVADFLALQRSTGSYQFLEGEAEQTAFLQRFVEFKSK